MLGCFRTRKSAVAISDLIDPASSPPGSDDIDPASERSGTPSRPRKRRVKPVRHQFQIFIAGLPRTLCRPDSMSSSASVTADSDLERGRPALGDRRAGAMGTSKRSQVVWNNDEAQGGGKPHKTSKGWLRRLAVPAPASERESQTASSEEETGSAALSKPGIAQRRRARSQSLDLTIYVERPLRQHRASPLWSPNLHLSPLPSPMSTLATPRGLSPTPPPLLGLTRPPSPFGIPEAVDPPQTSHLSSRWNSIEGDSTRTPLHPQRRMSSPPLFRRGSSSPAPPQVSNLTPSSAQFPFAELPWLGCFNKELAPSPSAILSPAGLTPTPSVMHKRSRDRSSSLGSAEWEQGSRGSKERTISNGQVWDSFVGEAWIEGDRMSTFGRSLGRGLDSDSVGGRSEGIETLGAVENIEIGEEGEVDGARRLEGHLDLAQPPDFVVDEPWSGCMGDLHGSGQSPLELAFTREVKTHRQALAGESAPIHIFPSRGAVKRLPSTYSLPSPRALPLRRAVINKISLPSLPPQSFGHDPSPVQWRDHLDKALPKVPSDLRLIPVSTATPHNTHDVSQSATCVSSGALPVPSPRSLLSGEPPSSEAAPLPTLSHSNQLQKSKDKELQSPFRFLRRKIRLRKVPAGSLNPVNEPEDIGATAESVSGLTPPASNPPGEKTPRKRSGEREEKRWSWATFGARRLSVGASEVLRVSGGEEL